MSVALVSKYANLHLIVRPTETMLDPQRGPVVVKPGLVVKFRNHVANVENDVAEEIKKSSPYIGTSEKVVWLATDDDCPAYAGSGRRAVKTGMSTGRVSRDTPPVDGWDQMTVRDIKAAIAANQIPNVSDAIAYESRKGGRRRSGVIKALSGALIDADEKPATKQRSAAKDETFSAPAPKDDGEK